MLHPRTPLIRFFPLLCALALPFSDLIAEKTYEPGLWDADSVEIYKKAPQRELVINIYETEDRSKAKSPAIIFYSGGGWVHADTAHFQRQARHYAAWGYTVFLPDYRVRNRDGTGVAECVEDATDAYRWVLDHAERLGIDSEAILLGGGSAGGHLALAVPLLHPELPQPYAILTYNPVTKTTPGGFHTPGAFRDRSNIAQVSLHGKVRPGLPPLLIQHGEADRVVPFENSARFAEEWEANGNRVHLIGYPGEDHGFFNKGTSYTQTLDATDAFLDELRISGASAPAAGESVVKPNIIFILADDMGYSDPGFLGGDIRTPNLDRLAAEGTVFTRFTNHAKCEPSRASLMTGVHFQRQTHDHVVRAFNNVTTVAELLSEVGYATYLSGKWHLPGNPVEHGFDRFFGLLGGASNHFDPTGRLGLPDKFYLHREIMLDQEPYIVRNDDFFTTNAFTDHALQFLEENPTEQPFFLYLAYTVPHWPLQAPEQIIESYFGHYEQGWFQLRQARFDRMQANGYLPVEWNLPEMPASVPEWENYSKREDAARSMAVHAAMVDNMDQQIGRVLDYLKATKQLANTLILFTSDNGAAGAIGPEGRFDLTPDTPAGPVDSFRMLPEGFVRAVNSPYREYKLSHLSGGDTAPLIAYWPGHAAAGRLVTTPVNILDIMPTLLELTGGTYPADLLPMDGEDFSQALLGGELGSRSPQILRLKYVEADEHAVIADDWKLYRSGNTDWELYNLKQDGTETANRAAEQPEVTRSLTETYEAFESTLSK